MMTAFPQGWETPADAIRMLRAIDGRESIELGEWDIDDFSSERNAHPAIERCRLRVRDELIDLLAARDSAQISRLISELISNLEIDAAQTDRAVQ